MGEAQPFLPGLERAPGPVTLNNRKYLGSKFRLLDFLTETIVSRAGDIAVFADPFAGTGVVAHRFLPLAGRIIVGDLLFSNYVVLRAFFGSAARSVDVGKVSDLLEELNHVASREGYVSRSYGGTYFTWDNAGRIDAVREAIETMRTAGRCNDQERFVLLASLLLAVDKVANTVGQYDAFLKHIEREPGELGERTGPVEPGQPAEPGPAEPGQPPAQGEPGSPAARRQRHLVDSNVHKSLTLLLPSIELGEAQEVYNEDANTLVRRIDPDVLYLDPPYNGRQYVDCYHVLENIMRWDQPPLQGKTRKFPREHLKSRYSRRQEAPQALAELVGEARAGHIFLSYNDEGIIPEETILEILEGRGAVERFEREYPVFGNGAGSARKRTIRERLYYCRPRRGITVDRGSAAKVELFDSKGRSRGFYSPRNRLNDLTGREWVYWTKSVITNPYPPSLQHALRSRHGGQKPPELCADLIRVFTKRGQRVLDPFAGVGGTLLGASLCGRGAVGIEVNPEWVEVYRQVCALEGISEQPLLCGDSRTALGEIGELADPPFDFLLTDVPYWSMDRVPRSKGKYKRVGEPQREARASKLRAFDEQAGVGKQEWLGLLREVFARSLPLLRAGAYLAVFIGDMYHDGRFHFLAADLAGILEALGVVPKANLVWYDVSKSLHVYGYQYEYIPSMIHQNVLVFRHEA